jgi:hypothetical protein
MKFKKYLEISKKKKVMKVPPFTKKNIPMVDKPEKFK